MGGTGAIDESVFAREVLRREKKRAASAGFSQTFAAVSVLRAHAFLAATAGAAGWCIWGRNWPGGSRLGWLFESRGQWQRRTPRWTQGQAPGCCRD